jgi:nucleotidyltransferase substrate binding protein (TIGR01987 family)
MNIVESFADISRFVALRRDIHAHPELGFEEHRTAALVAQLLSEWGLEVHTGVAGTGVVGVLKRGHSARSIGLRADLDALPLQEDNHFAHRSLNDGRMHACGHDGHTAMLLAAAHYLSKHRNFDGTVYLIFQPAEEGGGGAREMIKEGLIQRFEYTHELAWNVMKDYAEYQGNSTIGGSRDASREALQLKLISEGEIWMDMIISRNKTSHTYNEETANEIYSKILKEYYPAFVKFRNLMEEKRSGKQGQIFE